LTGFLAAAAFFLDAGALALTVFFTAFGLGLGL
jgi:hypothetical protein